MAAIPATTSPLQVPGQAAPLPRPQYPPPVASPPAIAQAPAKTSPAPAPAQAAASAQTQPTPPAPVKPPKDDDSSSSDSDVDAATSSLSQLNVAQDHATPPAPSTDGSLPGDAAADHPLIQARSGCYTPNIAYNARLFSKMRNSLAQCEELTRSTSSSMPSTVEEFKKRRDEFFTERSSYKAAKKNLKIAKKEQKKHDRYFRCGVMGQANMDRYNQYRRQLSEHQSRWQAMEEKDKEWMRWLSREKDWKDDFGGWTTWVKIRSSEDEMKKLQKKWHDSKKDYEDFLKDQKKVKEDRKLWDETVAPAWIQWENDIAAEQGEWNKWREEYGKEKKLTKPMKKQHKDDVKQWMDKWSKVWDEKK